jgi:hypothetical protein
MSGGGPGGSPNLALSQKHAPVHAGGGIQSGRHADFTGPKPTATSVGLKFGIRVKTGQTPTLVITTRTSPHEQMSLVPVDATNDFTADLRTAMGQAADEKWVAYTATWKKSFGFKFDSELTLDHFDDSVSANGFQIVTVAFCHDTQTFTDGVYSYAISVLPGMNTTAFPLGALKGSVGSGTKKGGAKKKSAAKKKSVAKKKAGAKKKAKR